MGKTHGLVVYAEDNISFVNSHIDDVFSLNSEHGALSGDYVYVTNSSFANIKGFGANGAAIHANTADVHNSTFYLVNSTDNKDHGGAIYANNTYAYNNNFTGCHAGEGAAIFSENHTIAIENIFVENAAQYSGQAIFTNTGFIQYNVLLNNSGIQWGSACDVAFSGSTVDSLEYNWWGLNDPFSVYGKDRAKTNVEHQSGQGDDFLPETWVIMKFFITDPDAPNIGQGVNLTTTLEDYYNSTDDTEYDLNHNIANRTVFYATESGEEYEGKFSHNSAPIINEDTVLYYSNNFVQHKVSSTIDYQTLYFDVAQFEINVTKTVTNLTPKIGDIINYTIIVTSNDTTNYSDPSAVILPHNDYYNITITDKLDDRLQYISSNDTSYNEESGEWYIENLKINSTYILNIMVRVKGSGNITNWANITKVNDTELKNPYGSNVTIEVNFTEFVELNVSKQIIGDVSDLHVGDTITYLINVTNNGNIDATYVNVTETLSNLVVVTGANPTHGEWNNETKVWEIPVLSNGTSAILTLTVRAIGAGTVSNAVVVKAKENDTEVTDDAPDVPVDADVHLNISKEVTSDVSDLHVGDSIVYVITVNNTGLSDATFVNVTESLSGLVVVTDAVTVDGTWNNATKVWEVGTVASKGSATLTLTVRVVSAGTVSNAVVVKAKENDTEVTDDAPDVPVDADVHLNISKEVTSDVSDLHVGDSIVYVITVNNTGLSDATFVNVTESLSGLVVVTDTVIGVGEIVSCVDDSGNVYAGNVWTIDTVGAGDSVTLTVVVHVTAEGTVANNVTARSDGNDTNVSDETPEAEVSPDVKLDIVKVVNVTDALVGDYIEFTITVTNNGVSNATNVVVSDTLAQGFGYSSSTPKGDYDVNTRSVVWIIDQIESGESIVLHLFVRAVDNGTFNNTASAYSEENETAVNDTTGNVTIDPLVDVAIDLEVDNTTPKVNDIVIITLKVNNYGPSTATNVTGKLNHDYLTALEIISIDSGDSVLSQGLLGIVLSNGLTINDDGSFEIDHLDAGDEVTAIIKARVLRDGIIIVDGVVGSNEEDSNHLNNYDDITIEAQPVVDLSVNKTVSNNNPTLGDIIEYTITVVNAGPSNATEVTVLEKLPDGLTYVSDDGQGAYDHNTGLWTLNTVNANETKILNIKVQVSKTGEITNNVNASSKEENINPDGGKNNATINVKPKVVDLDVTIGANTTKPTVNDTVEFTITIVNKGATNATGVNVTGVLPDGFKFISDDGEGSYDPNSGIWTIDNLTAGETKVLHIVIQATKAGNFTYSVKTVANEVIANETSAQDSITIEVVEPKPAENSTDNETHVAPEVQLKPTGNPLVILIMALLFAGVSLRRRKQ